MQALKTAFTGLTGGSHSTFYPHAIELRIGELSLAGTLPAALSEGKFHPYVTLRRGDDMASRIKSATIKSGWTGGATSAYGLTFNETHKLDVNAASDILHVELWDDNLLRDTLIASGTLPLSFLLTSPAGASSGPQSVTLNTSDRFREHGGRSTARGTALPFGSLTIFAHLLETRPRPGSASAGAATTDAGHTGPRGGMIGAALGALGMGGASKADKHHSGGGGTAAMAAPAMSADASMPRSTATTGGPLTTAAVGDADALGRRGAPPTALSSGTSALGASAEVWDFHIMAAELDYSAIAREYKLKLETLTRSLDPYIMLRVNHNPATSQKTSTVKDVSKGCIFNQTLRMYTNEPGDVIGISLYDDNVMKDTCMGYAEFRVSELLSFTMGERSIPLYAWHAAGKGTHSSGAAGSATTAGAAMSAMGPGSTSTITSTLRLSITRASDLSTSSVGPTSSLLLAAGEQAHLGATGLPASGFAGGKTGIESSMAGMSMGTAPAGGFPAAKAAPASGFAQVAAQEPTMKAAVLPYTHIGESSMKSGGMAAPNQGFASIPPASSSVISAPPVAMKTESAVQSVTAGGGVSSVSHFSETTSAPTGAHFYTAK